MQLLHFDVSIKVHTYLINGINILPADKVVHLGIIMDNDLNYSCHISSIISKARSRTGIIFRSFFLHNIFLLRQAYIMFVRPILEYASQVWDPSVLKYISDLEIVQRNFNYHTRSIKHFSYRKRLAVLNLESLELSRLKAHLVSTQNFKQLNFYKL